ncbi:MAG TPA: hypothetical protein VJT73_21450 [Polyangiaceae bacterium]|nr:hypothetical protein [Polyangiaceae bacterium]
MRSPICVAIRSRVLLEFEYDGLRRVVAPYCHGRTRSGEALRGVQVRGESRSKGLGFGKLWTVARMRHVHLLQEAFEPSDPDYNPHDSAMLDIHCRI